MHQSCTVHFSEKYPWLWQSSHLSHSYSQDQLLLCMAGTTSGMAEVLSTQSMGRDSQWRCILSTRHLVLSNTKWISSLISPAMGPYFSYHGSLTAPGCNKVFHWIVFKTSLSIYKIQVTLHIKDLINKLGIPIEMDAVMNWVR